MKTLQKIWADLANAGYETDKGSVHDYIRIYEELLAPYRETAIRVLEVGLFNGHSLRMWEEYFRTNEVIGIDCDEQPHGGLADLRPMINEGGHHILIGDATNDEFLDKWFGRATFDVVIEDAAHNVQQQLDIYEAMKPRLHRGAIYIIEDIQDIDGTREIFENIDPYKEVTIIDNRKVRPRYDDVICVIKDKFKP